MSHCCDSPHPHLEIMGFLRLATVLQPLLLEKSLEVSGSQSSVLLFLLNTMASIFLLIVDSVG